MTVAGELKERLRFESPTPFDDGAGNTTYGWTKEFTLWAKVQPLRGGEQVLADRLQGTQPVVIIVRRQWESLQILPDWRAVDDRSGAVYQIKSPPADMKMDRAYLDMLAEAGIAG